MLQQIFNDMCMKLTKDELKVIIRRAMDQLLTNEGSIIQNHINERTLTAHLANYLEPFFKNYHVDCEYNRNYESGKYKPKYLSSHLTYPDIIIHRRLENKNNLVCIEVKTSYFDSNTLTLEIEKDKRKLLDFITPDNGYNFEYGVYIYIDADSLSYKDEYFN